MDASGSCPLCLTPPCFTQSAAPSGAFFACLPCFRHFLPRCGKYCKKSRDFSDFARGQCCAASRLGDLRNAGRDVMKRVLLSLGLIAGAVTLSLYSLPAQAQATRTWVSGVGDDAQSLQPHRALQDFRRRDLQDRHQRHHQLPRSRRLRRRHHHQIHHHRLHRLHGLDPGGRRQRHHHQRDGRQSERPAQDSASARPEHRWRRQQQPHRDSTACAS